MAQPRPAVMLANTVRTGAAQARRGSRQRRRGGRQVGCEGDDAGRDAGGAQDDSCGSEEARLSARLRVELGEALAGPDRVYKAERIFLLQLKMDGTEQEFDRSF